MIKNYFKTAWRSAWKNKTTSLINIAGLAVGMTAAVFILIWVQNETSFDTAKGTENVYRLTTKLPVQGWTWESTPLLLADAIKKELPGIEKTTRLNTNGAPVFNINNNLFYEKNCAYVDNEWFNFFPYKFIEGDAHYFNTHLYSAILTQTEAKKLFGTNRAVGQSIRIDSTDYRVAAVVADPAVNSSFQYNVFLTIDALLTNPRQRENDEQWGNDNYLTFVKLSPAANARQVAKQINELRHKKANSDETNTEMISLADMHLETEVENSAFIHGNRNTIYIFSFLGFLLLLTACINYVNLTTAKASLRAKEVSIRKITGASRKHLFLQFVAESIIISVTALITTLLLMQVCLPMFNAITEKHFSLALTSAALWKLLGATLLATIVLNSIYPALLLSSFKPLNVFRGATVLKVKDASFRKSLVVLQFTFSIILIACTIIIYRQMQFVQKSNPGYNRSQVLSFRLPYNIDRSNRESIVRTMKQDLLSQSGIEAVSVSNQSAVNVGSACTECADWAGRDTSYNPKIAQLSTDADFQKTMQLQMKEGRWFRDGADKKNIILNETAVKNFRLQQPVIGQWFVFKGDTGQVIGVVKDFNYKSMHEKMGALVVFNNASWQYQFSVRMAGKNAAQTIPAIERIWKKNIAGSPFEHIFLDDTFNELYKQDQQTSYMVLIFAAIAILVSAMGLFGLAAFAAEQRTKEIGIRKILGASIAGITALLSKDFIKLVGIAIVIASPVAWWAMNKWMQNFAYHISISWWMFVAAGALALLIALFTISFQSVKAAMANPVKSLRTE
ncbi:MAG: ABC transporter permease [Chitinophagaceae bacterium]